MITVNPTRQLLIETTVASALESVRSIPAPAGWAAAPVGSAHPWDEAHRAVANPAALGLEAAAPVYAEPDLVQSFPIEGPDDIGLESLRSAGPCRDEGPDDFWPVGEPLMGWHLDADHSGLRAAHDQVGDPAGRRVRIAHLDTGYDPEHASRPLRLLTEIARNFAGGDPADATDPGRHFPLNNPGHGTATLALLAGCRVVVPAHGFDDILGGAPHAEVVPIRIADSVIHFRTSAMARGIEYAAEAGCHVLSVSMGGIPSRAWATAVNRAYDAGVAMFAAAGNRIGPSPPSTIVWPARFNRVVAVCGVTADKSPYYRPGLHRHMQGCFGPAAKMATALATFTPNAPWAVMGCGGLVSFGGGTSSATPQAAAAAALWVLHHPTPGGVAPWQRVEAVRDALFSAADTSAPDSDLYFGRGMLRADAALAKPFRTDLPKSPEDSVSFPWLRAAGVLETIPIGRDLMYEVEALQVFFRSPGLQQIAGGADPLTDDLSAADRQRVLDSLRTSPLASQTLRSHVAALRRGP